jgi:glycerol-3-phosphate dehydrogenase (NAD(P)+)
LETIQKITIIGAGSWATALVKIFSESNVQISWYLRKANDVSYVNEHGRNPGYLSHTMLPMSYIHPTSDIEEAIDFSDTVLFVVPSAYLPSTLSTIPDGIMDNKWVLSSIKGMIPGASISASEFLNQKLGLKKDRHAIIAGPCHAEEVAMERKTYVTVSSLNEEFAGAIAASLRPSYIQTILNNDPMGVEYAAILKNIIGLACGIAHGLNYGDNFQAVLVSNSFIEIRQFLELLDPRARDLSESAYFGDLLVTAFSPFSRNRHFGQMIGRGYSVQAAQLQMRMVAEGYYAVEGIYNLSRKLGIEMPVTSAIYRILYNFISPFLEFRLLEKKFK